MKIPFNRPMLLNQKSEIDTFLPGTKYCNTSSIPPSKHKSKNPTIKDCGFCTDLLRNCEIARR